LADEREQRDDTEPAGEHAGSQPTEESAQYFAQLVAARRDKLGQLARLTNQGESYPYRFDRTHDIARLREQEEALVAASAVVRTAGRLMAKRGTGKTLFATLQDGAGRIQVYFKRDNLGEEHFRAVQKLLDIGDIIGVGGTLFRTRTGELTVHVQEFQLLAKALRPLPEKYHDMSLELKSRRRYLDLAMNPETRERFRRRTAIVAALREFFTAEGFLEVETPALQPLYGGATARPFTTYHNALDTTLYLRIADELYLKRLVVGGLEKVFEIAKDFRNEGMDRTHNPEFTMLEAYAAYWDYGDMLALSERLLGALGGRFGREGKVPFGAHELDLQPPFRRVRFLDALAERSGIDFAPLDRDAVAAQARGCGIEVQPGQGRDKLLDLLFSELVEPGLIQPTFVMDHPRELSPLAKSHRSAPGLVERFELFAGGFELVNAFSELNDPDEQRRRFLDQKVLREDGDDEAQVLDEDFLQALEHGMPPAGGLGLGVDRLVMLLCDCHAIRDVLLFPHLRSEEGGVAGDPAAAGTPPADEA
jgi:lysyl-tRNA synthetase class 2